MALREWMEPGDWLIKGEEVRLVAQYRLRASCMRILLESSHLQAFAGSRHKRGERLTGARSQRRGAKEGASREIVMPGWRLLALLAQPMGALIATRSRAIS